MYYKNLYYEETIGSRGNLIFIHGWGGNHSTFKPLLPFLKNYSCYFLHLPGFNDIPIPEALGLNDYALLIMEFIKEKRIERPIIIGHSFGGRIALKMATLASFKIVLVQTPGYDLKSFKTRIKLLINRFLGLSFPSKDYSSATTLQRQIMKKAFKDTKEIKMEEIQAPTLIIANRSDRVVKFKVAKKMHKQIKSSGIVQIGSSHFPQLDDPYKLALVVDYFANC